MKDLAAYVNRIEKVLVLLFFLEFDMMDVSIRS